MNGLNELPKQRVVWMLFRFPTNGKAHRNSVGRTIDNAPVTEFRFPTNGKAHRNGRSLERLVLLGHICFDSLPTGKHTGTVCQLARTGSIPVYVSIPYQRERTAERAVPRGGNSLRLWIVSIPYQRESIAERHYEPESTGEPEPVYRGLYQFLVSIPYERERT